MIQRFQLPICPTKYSSSLWSSQGGNFANCISCISCWAAAIHYQNIQGPCILGDLVSSDGSVAWGWWEKAWVAQGPSGESNWLLNHLVTWIGVFFKSCPFQNKRCKKERFIHPPKQPKNDQSTNSWFWWSLLAGIAWGGVVPRYWWRCVTSIPFKNKLGRFMLRHIGALLQWKS